LNVYSVALFFHICGAIGYFFGIGTNVFALSATRRAQSVVQVRALVRLTYLSGPLTGLSVLLILVAGFYMALSAWSLRTSWIAVALISLILMAPLGAALIEPRRRAIDRLAREAQDGPLPEALARQARDPVLVTALQTTVALLFGIVFLMTTKPDLAGSLIAMAVALVIGLASGLLVSRGSGQTVTTQTNRISKVAS
jgi:uncharacterized membrane protein